MVGDNKNESERMKLNIFKKLYYKFVRFLDKWFGESNGLGGLGDSSYDKLWKDMKNGLF